MKFVKINEIPVRKTRHSLKHMWEEFMGMNTKIVKIDFTPDEYKSPAVARSVLSRSIKLYGFPIDITQRGDDVYLIRRDM